MRDLHPILHKRNLLSTQATHIRSWVGTSVHPMADDTALAAGRDRAGVGLDGDQHCVIVNKARLLLAGEGYTHLVRCSKFTHLDDGA